jgi:rhodanese-related sulfurtransferase
MAMKSPSIPRLFAMVWVMFLALLPVAGMPRAEISSNALRAVHKWATLRHAAVRQLSAGALAMLHSHLPQSLIILDVREPAEYKVSRLPGAIRVSPAITPKEFEQRVGRQQLADKTLVLYCSVGARSSGLASRLIRAGSTDQAETVYNLAGGIFNWHNDKRPLLDDSTRTDLVHPYNRVWARLIERRQLVSYGPNQATRSP